MAVYKDETRGTWYASFYYTDWQGKRVKKLKRGFATKKEGQAFEREFLQKSTSNLSMTFESFFEIYEKDMKSRLRETTWLNKQCIIEQKILPYFKNKKMNEIKPSDIIEWQNQMITYRNENGEPYSPTYLKTMHNQISAIFNHATRYYELGSNPARKAGNMGKKEAKEMSFWTKEEYLKFADMIMDKPMSYYAFQMLYWCGIRMGELLALTPNDFNFDNNSFKISKSYQRIKGRDVITPPKTEKSNRIVIMPDFLTEEIKECINGQYKLGVNQRIFCISKASLHHEMDRGSKISGVKRIRIHDLRHSHVSLLIEMGFSTIAIADRVGHESIDITYRYAHLFPSKQNEIANRLNMGGEI